MQRLEWIDLAKGVGILLVVIGHAGRGVLNAGVPDENALLPLMDRAIYAFHMPLFFVLSGVTFGMRPPANIMPTLAQKTWRLFYALAIWTYAFLAMRALAGSNTNTGGSWGDLLILPVPPVAHFWFLWALLVITVAFTILRLGSRSIIPDFWFWIVAVVCSTIAHFVVTLPDVLQPFFSHALSYSLPFTLGAMLGASPLLRHTPGWSAAGLGAFFFSIGLWTSLAFKLPISSVLTGTALALFLLIPVIFISARYKKLRWAQQLMVLGALSLAIYVMHTIFSAATRIMLLEIGIEDLTTHLVLGTAAGIIGPVFAYSAVRRFGMLRQAGLA